MAACVVGDRRTLSVKVSDVSRESVQFVVFGTTRHVMNSLRRALLELVPCLAVDSVKFHSFNTVNFHEFQIHVLELVPLKCDSILDDIIMMDECDCLDQCCSKCSVKLSLNVSNTKTKSNLSVTNHDLISSDDRVQPIDEILQINQLGPGQTMILTAFARKGKRFDLENLKRKPTKKNSNCFFSICFSCSLPLFVVKMLLIHFLDFFFCFHELNNFTLIKLVRNMKTKKKLELENIDNDETNKKASEKSTPNFKQVPELKCVVSEDQTHRNIQLICFRQK